MGYAEVLRTTFPDLEPVVDDLFLLEAHEVADLPERAPSRELAAVVHAHPALRRFLVARHPPVEPVLAGLLAEHPPVRAEELAGCEQAVVWEVADWIVYQRAPQYYDARSTGAWDVSAVTDVVPLAGAVVIDAGAGTGRVTFAVAALASEVFAVEPVVTLRGFMRDKATRLGMRNVHVVDGFLHAIPLPARTADVLITCQSIGWDLPRELPEIERVLRPGGMALHVFGVPAAGPSDGPLFRALLAAGYRYDRHRAQGLLIHRYVKRMPGSRGRETAP